MFVMNHGALMHYQGGSLKSGLNEVDDKAWAEVEKLPMVAKALKDKRLEKVAKGKEAPKGKDEKK